MAAPDPAPTPETTAALRRIRGHFAAHLSVARADGEQERAEGARRALADVDLIAAALNGDGRG